MKIIGIACQMYCILFTGIVSMSWLLRKPVACMFGLHDRLETRVGTCCVKCGMGLRE